MHALIGRASGRATFGFVSRNEAERPRLNRSKEELAMADPKTPALPDGTDTIIEGGAEPINTGAIATDRTGGRDEDGETLTIEDAAVTERETATRAGSAEGGLADRLRSGGEKLANQAGDKARGLVSQ